jgi:isocitrate dehydrogenase
MYWAQALAEQEADAELQAYFAPLARSLTENEEKIVEELNSVQGKSVDIGGYFIADAEKTREVMRPSATLNAVLASAQG